MVCGKAALNSPSTLFRDTVSCCSDGQGAPEKVWNLIPGSQEEPWEQNFKQTDEVLSEISGLSLPVVELFGKTSHLFVNSHWGVLKAPTLSTFKGRVVLGKIADSRVFGVRGCCRAWPPIPEFPRCEDCPISDCGQIIA